MAWYARLCSLPIQPTLISPPPSSVMPLSLTCPTMTNSLSAEGDWWSSMICPRRRRLCDGAGRGECGPGRSGEQGGIGTDRHERPALFDALGGADAVVDQEPTGLAVAPACGEHGVQSLSEGRGRGVAGNTEVVAEIPGADEQHVDTVDGRDLVDGRYGRSGFDLGDDQDLLVRSVKSGGVETEAAGPVVGRDAAVPVR